MFIANAGDFIESTVNSIMYERLAAVKLEFRFLNPLIHNLFKLNGNVSVKARLKNISGSILTSQR